MADGGVYNIIPAVILWTLDLPPNRFTILYSLVDTPGADFFEIMKGLITFLSSRIMPRPLDEPLIHEFNFIVRRTHVDEPVEGFYHRLRCRFGLFSGLLPLSDKGQRLL